MQTVFRLILSVNRSQLNHVKSREGERQREKPYKVHLFRRCYNVDVVEMVQFCIQFPSFLIWFKLNARKTMRHKIRWILVGFNIGQCHWISFKSKNYKLLLCYFIYGNIEFFFKTSMSTIHSNLFELQNF